MSARVFIHPRCTKAGAANDLFNATLEQAGFDLARTVIYTVKEPKVYELVTRVARHLDDSCTYRRMDGSEFWKPAAALTPPPRPGPSLSSGPKAAA